MVLLVLVIKVDEYVAVYAVRSQQDQDDEIRNQQGEIKAVDLVEALESLVEKMLADVLPNAAIGQTNCQTRQAMRRDENGTQRKTPLATFPQRRRVHIVPDGAVRWLSPDV